MSGNNTAASEKCRVPDGCRSGNAMPGYLAQLRPKAVRERGLGAEGTSYTEKAGVIRQLQHKRTMKIQACLTVVHCDLVGDAKRTP
ncbi:hypothetical protein RSAG8_12441, partial [Rhizoctonia solani AG-8 WAC10335]